MPVVLDFPPVGDDDDTQPLPEGTSEAPNNTPDASEEDDWRQLSIMGDVDMESVVPTIEQLIKSHIHRAAGACRYLEKDLTIWIDFPIQNFKKSHRVIKEVIPWQTPEPESRYDGNYSCHTTPALVPSGWGGHQAEDYWGLAPAMQMLKFEDDAIFRLMGITIKEYPHIPFLKQNKEPWEDDRKMKSLIMEYEKISRAPWSRELAKFCQL